MDLAWKIIVVLKVQWPKVKFRLWSWVSALELDSEMIEDHNQKPAYLRSTQVFSESNQISLTASSFLQGPESSNTLSSLSPPASSWVLRMLCQRQTYFDDLQRGWLHASNLHGFRVFHFLSAKEILGGWSVVSSPKPPKKTGGLWLSAFFQEL